MENNEQPIQEVPMPKEEAPRPKSRFWMLFLGLFLLGLVFLGGTYYFISSQKTAQPPMITNEAVDTQKDVNQLDTELDSLDMKDIESDFTEIDQELKNL